MSDLTAAQKVEVLKDLTTERRSVYNFKPELPSEVTEAQVKEIVQHFVKHTPTSFNSQSIRAIILWGDAHKKVWDSVYEETKEFPFSARAKSLKDTAYGTIVFFDDQETIDRISAKFVGYKELFPFWAAHANGSAEIAIWKALSALGLGANLQHLNKWVGNALKGKVNDKWNVVAQLAFGVPIDGPSKEKLFIENEVQEFKSL